MKGLAKFVGALLVAGLVLTPTSGGATEPTNNVAPWGTGQYGMFHGDVSLFTSNIVEGDSSWYGLESIMPAGDVDYQLVACQGRVVKEVRLWGFSNDMDIMVYDQAGNFIGSSTGVDPKEVVNVAALNVRGVILRIYGYRSATSPYYGVGVSC